MNTVSTISETVSRIFREAFESHPARNSDPGLALASARETANEAIPAGVTGSFDDESLTFAADSIRSGHLVDYRTGETIRPATEEERKASLAAAEQDGGRGVIEVDGRSVYVDG